MSPAGFQEAKTLAAAVEVVSAEDGDLKGRAPGLEGNVTESSMYPGHPLEEMSPGKFSPGDTGLRVALISTQGPLSGPEVGSSSRTSREASEGRQEDGKRATAWEGGKGPLKTHSHCTKFLMKPLYWDVSVLCCLLVIGCP